MLAIALVLTAAVQQAPCVALPKGTAPAVAQAAGKPWYISSEPITVGKARYTKYGLPRVLRKGDVAFLASYKGAAVYAEAGNPQREVVYLLTGLGACEFQPYAKQ